MAWPGITADVAMLTAAIRLTELVIANIRRGVEPHDGSERRQFSLTFPAIIKRRGRHRFKNHLAGLSPRTAATAAAFINPQPPFPSPDWPSLAGQQGDTPRCCCTPASKQLSQLVLPVLPYRLIFPVFIRQNAGRAKNISDFPHFPSQPQEDKDGCDISLSDAHSDDASDQRNCLATAGCRADLAECHSMHSCRHRGSWWNRAGKKQMCH